MGSGRRRLRRGPRSLCGDVVQQRDGLVVLSSGRELESALCRHRKEHHTTFRKAALLHAYTMLVGRGELDACASLHGLLVKKSSKSQSGVLVITVLTSPYPRVGDKVQKFSCQWN